MAIVYDAPSNTITVTGYTEGVPCTFNDIWLADQAGGWGVISKQGTSQFLIACAIDISDNNTETWFADEDVEVYVDFDASGSAYFITVRRYGHLRFGVLEDATNKLSSSGCTFLSTITGVNYKRWIDSYLGYGANIDVRLYSCWFRSAVRHYIRAPNDAPIYNCIFENTRPELGSIMDIYDLTSQGTDAGLPAMTGTFDRILIHHSTVGLAFYSSYVGVIENTVLRNNTYALQGYSLSTDIYLIDVESDVWNIQWVGTSTGEIYRQYTMNIHVVDNAGVAVNGATVTLKDKDDNTVFSVTTGADGTISQQTFSRGYYDQPHGDTLQEYAPHTLTVEHVSYVTSSTVFTIDAPISWIIALLPALTGDAVVSDVSSGKTFYNTDPLTKLIGTLIPVAPKQYLLGVKERAVPVYYFRDILHVIGTVKPQQHALRKTLQAVGTVNPDQRILRETLEVVGTTVKYKQFHDTISVKGKINILGKKN